MVKYASRLLSGTPKGGETATKQKRVEEDVQDIINEPRIGGRGRFGEI